MQTNEIIDQQLSIKQVQQPVNHISDRAGYTHIL